MLCRGLEDWLAVPLLGRRSRFRLISASYQDARTTLQQAMPRYCWRLFMYYTNLMALELGLLQLLLVCR
jgi:hypothetical protein